MQDCNIKLQWETIFDVCTDVGRALSRRFEPSQRPRAIGAMSRLTTGIRVVTALPCTVLLTDLRISRPAGLNIERAIAIPF